MTIYLPGAMFAAGISLYLFYEYNRVKQAKQEERRESLNDRRQQYLQQLIEAKKKEPGAEEEPQIAGLSEGEPGSGDSN